MNCPHCLQPIDPALILKARQTEIAKRPRGKHERPGAKGLVRNGCRHNVVSSTAAFGNVCRDCHRPLRWDSGVGKWRLIRTPKQKSPAN